MRLSGRDLELYVELGRLKIDPITPEQFQQNGIDLVLQEIRHMAGPFYLGSTREVLEFPDDLMANVNLRSTWARCGFFVPPTIVDAGFKGNLTLEIWASPFQSPMEAIGQRFAHLTFDKTVTPCVPYNGRYQDQRGITLARVESGEKNEAIRWHQS